MMKVTINANKKHDVKAGQVRFGEDLHSHYVLVITDGYGKYNAVILTKEDNKYFSAFETAFDAFQDGEELRSYFPYVVDAELIINERAGVE